LRICCIILEIVANSKTSNNSIRLVIAVLIVSIAKLAAATLVILVAVAPFKLAAFIILVIVAPFKCDAYKAARGCAASSAT